MPVGWQERAPANLVRGSSALDPAYFVLEAVPGSQESLKTNLMAQLGQDTDMEPVQRRELGHYTWDLYEFNIQAIKVIHHATSE